MRWPASGVLIRSPVSTSFSSPIMANSVTPMPKPPMARARMAGPMRVAALGVRGAWTVDVMCLLFEGSYGVGLVATDMSDFTKLRGGMDIPAEGRDVTPHRLDR